MAFRCRAGRPHGIYRPVRYRTLMTRTFDDDSRGVSESAGVAALVLLTVVVTASVGLGVLFVDTGEEEGLQASFSFQYFSNRASLFVTYEDGPELQASNVIVEGAENRLSWAALRELNETATISPGDNAQLTTNNAYGARVTGSANVTVLYVQGDNRTVLGEWTPN